MMNTPPRRFDHTFTCGNIRAKVWVNGDDFSCSFARMFMGGSTYYVGQDDFEDMKKCIDKVQAFYEKTHGGPDAALPFDN